MKNEDDQDQENKVTHEMTDEEWREAASHLTKEDLLEVATAWRKRSGLVSCRLKALESTLVDNLPLVDNLLALLGLEEATHVLLLNDMRFPKVEQLREVCIGSESELQALLDRESVELYRDGGWCKTYRKDGPLEWCNRPNGESGIRVYQPSVPPHVSDFEKLASVRQNIAELEKAEDDCVEEPEPMSDITGCDY